MPLLCEPSFRPQGYPKTIFFLCILSAAVSAALKNIKAEFGPAGVHAGSVLKKTLMKYSE
jgi:hypothetical protein